jgi:hypothetical protein
VLIRPREIGRRHCSGQRLPFLVEVLFSMNGAICDGFRVRNAAVGPMLCERGESVQALHLDAEFFEDVLDAIELGLVGAVNCHLRDFDTIGFIQQDFFRMLRRGDSSHTASQDLCLS